MAAVEGAVRTLSVERTGTLSESRNAAFERRFASPARNPFLGWNPASRSIRSYHFLDAVLDGEFRGLFNSAGFIRGTGYLVPDDFMMTLGIDDARLTKVPGDTTAIVGCTVGRENYFHWTTQSLPAIDHAVRRLGNTHELSLVLPTLKPWQEESLRLLGHAGVKRVVVNDTKRQYAFDRVEYSEILNGGAAFCLSEVTHRTYARLRGAVAPVPRSGRRIYVSRADAASRRMRNESAVIEEVRKRGFEIVDPGALTFTEQIRLFRSAGMVVGPHGAGLTNIAFCEPGTVVYELVPAHYTNACFCNLARIGGLRYWADRFESPGTGPANFREWESDTHAVAERLSEIESFASDA